MEHVPATLGRRRLDGASRADRPPIRRDEIDIYAEALQQVGRNVPLRLCDRLVLSDQAGDRLAGITAFRQEFLRGIEIARPFQNLAPLLGIERRAGSEETRQRFPQRRIVPDQRPHVILLTHCCEDRAACTHVIERRIEMIHAKAADVAQRIGDFYCDVAVPAQDRHQVGDGAFPPIHFAGLQRRGGRGLIGHHDPLDAVDQHPLAACKPGARLIAGDIARELLEDGLTARHPLVPDENA